MRRAAVRLDEVQEQVDRRALAGVVRAEQTEHFSWLDRQVQPVERHLRSVPFCQIDRLKHASSCAI
jgi:hypothetical protein